MNANELRIGNYVLNNGFELFKISWISNSIEVCKLNPIPLTEEWLLKFGFYKLESTIYTHIGCIEIGTIANGKRFYIQIGTENVTLNIEHVHQLQNLYFALTGLELIKK